MKHLLSISFIWILFLTIGCAQQPAVRPHVENSAFDKKISKSISFTVPVISPEQLKEMPENTLILDTRAQEEYDVSHIPAAQFADYKDFDKNQWSRMDKDRPVVVYCSIGYRSEKIGEQFQKMGFTKVYNLYGSIFEWVNQGNEVVDKEGVPTDKVHTYNRNWSQWVDETKAEKVW